MAGGTLFVKVLPEKGAEKAISAVVERGGAGAEEQGKKSGGLFALGFAGAAAAGIGRGLQTAAALQQIEVSLTTLTGSASDARELLNDLTDFAARTPFEMKGLAENAQQLLGVGVAAEDVIPTLQSLGDASAALGLSQEQMDRVLRAVTQSLAKGKFQQEELLQIAEAGIPIYGLMADALGTTVPEMQAMATNGELLAEDVLPKLLEQMDQNYAGGMVAQSETLNGVISTLKDTIDLGLSAAVQDLIPLLTDLVPSAAKAAGGVLTAFGVGIKIVTTLAYPFIQALDALLEGFGSLPAPIQVAIVAAVLLGRVLGGLGIIGTIKAIWGMVTAMYAAGAAATGVTGRLSAMGRAAVGAAGRAGFGALISSLVGGGWGLALIAIGTVIAGIMEVVGQADAAREHIEGLVSDVSLTASGQGTAAAIRTLTDEIEANEAALKERGLYANWAVEEDNNIAAARDKIDELNAAQERYNDNVKRTADSLGLTVGQLEALAAAGGVDLDLLAGTPEDVATFRAELEGANAAIENGFDPTTALGEAMTTLGDEASTAADKSDALREALAALAGDKVGILEATAAWQESLAGLTESFQTTNEEGETVLNDLALSAVDAAGNIDLMSEAGRGVQAAVLDAADAMRTQASAAYDAAVANGDVAGAAAAAGAAAQAARDDFIQQAQDIGLTREQAEGLADTYGLLPSEVVTAVATPGMSEAQLNTAILESQLISLPPNTPVRVTSLTDEAMTRLEVLGFTVTHLPDGSIEVTAPNAEAVGRLIDDQADRDRTAVIDVRFRTVGAAPGLGSQATVNAEGARYEFYRDGGLRGARAMSAHWAKMVPANTLRVIGDRARGREWFIPEDAPNTLPLLADAAQAHGLALVRAMADGGLLGGRPTPAVVGGRQTNIKATIYAAPDVPTAEQLYRVQRRAEVLARA